MSTREFDCIECGRHIHSYGTSGGDDHGLCAACVFFPSWFKRPELRQRLDPTHDGLDAIERQQLREAR